MLIKMDRGWHFNEINLRKVDFSSSLLYGNNYNNNNTNSRMVAQFPLEAMHRNDMN